MNLIIANGVYLVAVSCLHNDSSEDTYCNYISKLLVKISSCTCPKYFCAFCAFILFIFSYHKFNDMKQNMPSLCQNKNKINVFTDIF